MKRILFSFILWLFSLNTEAQTLQRVSSSNGYAEGSVIGGKRQGTWTGYSNEGHKLWDCDFIGGIANGWFIKYSKTNYNQVLIEGMFEDGFKTGQWCYFNATTALVDSTLIYSKGILIKKL